LESTVHDSGIGGGDAIQIEWGILRQKDHPYAIADSRRP